MRLKFGLKTVALPLALLCMAVPVLTAIYLVHRQAEQAENRLILQYARETLSWAEQTGDQLSNVSTALKAIPPDQRCTEKGLAIMRQLDLESTLLQAVGYMDGNVVRCSSFAGTQPIALGRPYLKTNRNVTVWIDVPLPQTRPDFLVFSFDGPAGIVHRDLALSFIGKAPGLTIGSFNWSHRVALITRGRYDLGWIRRPLPSQSVFRDKGWLVAVVQSHRYDIGSVAAIPLARTATFEKEAALVLLPIGLVTGIVFALLIVHVVRSRLSLPSLIQIGLRRKEFSLVFQPGVSLTTGQIVAAEALMRWQRPDGESVPPDVFIAAAEDAGMIRLLTERVLELLGEMEELRALPADFPFAINLAAADLHTPATVEALRRFIARPGPGPHNLIAETTERSLVDAEQARSVIQQIRALGIRVAIDDFGTGYCSLGYLATLNVDFIKIDKLFVKALGTDSPTSSVAAHIIELAQDLNLRTVAEGIETEEQATLLRGLGVNTGQGWLFGRPMSAAELVERVLADRMAREHEDLAADASAA